MALWPTTRRPGPPDRPRARDLRILKIRGQIPHGAELRRPAAPSPVPGASARTPRGNPSRRAHSFPLRPAKALRRARRDGPAAAECLWRVSQSLARHDSNRTPSPRALYFARASAAAHGRRPRLQPCNAGRREGAQRARRPYPRLVGPAPPYPLPAGCVAVDRPSRGRGGGVTGGGGGVARV